MLRALVLATVLCAVPGAAPAQSLGMLHIRIVVLDAEGKVTPVPRHALLISDNPSSMPPRRVLTRTDGTVDVRLRPGNYTVESDQPLAFQGKVYEWRRTLDIAEGGDIVLEFTAGNADVGTSASAPSAPAASSRADISSLLTQWQGSVVAIWTPTTHASGLVIDTDGLIVTNERTIGSATSVEVQLTSAVKVRGTVLVADADRDVGIIRIDPKALGSMRPVPLGCTNPSMPSLAAGQEVSAIVAPLRRYRDVSFGTISRVDTNAIVSDLILATGSQGGPVFSAGGDMIGITSADEGDERSRGSVRIVRLDDVCHVVAVAQKQTTNAALPDATHLPVEPSRPYPVDLLEDGMQRRAGSLNPYRMSVSDFDVTLITPVLNYAAHARADGGGQGRAGRTPMPLPTDFSNWSEYVEDVPPVLLIRVTPRLVEGFWTRVGRAAAQTQGVALPPIKRFRSGFLRMTAFCGAAEVTPIHPFKLEQRASETEAIYEGLYVFDPNALGPDCGTVTLALYSEKEPEKGNSRVIDPGVIQQIWRDFAPYRGLN